MTKEEEEEKPRGCGAQATQLPRKPDRNQLKSRPECLSLLVGSAGFQEKP